MTHKTWEFLSGETREGVRVTLRPLHIDDVDFIGRWRNQEELRRVLGMDYPVSHASILEWVQRATSVTANPGHISLGICVDGQIIGTAGIHEISLRHRNGTLGIYLGDQANRKQGIGSVVYELLLRYAFQELDLRAVRAEVYGHNEPSKKLHERLGFLQVGCIPEWHNRGGEYQDLLTYFISKKDWVATQ